MDYIFDLLTRISWRLGAIVPDYREILFEELIARLGDKRPLQILEIGPKDGQDTKRLMQLNPEKLVLVDLPDKEADVREWLKKLPSNNIELIMGNIMYGDLIAKLGSFDLVWCTGVLYHNPEQLRMIRILVDFLNPGGILVLESVTARRHHLRNEACVEIWHNIKKTEHKRHHVSRNVTHLPSQLAIKAWLEMVGMQDIRQSRSHSCVLRKLAKTRVAYISYKPLEDASLTPSTYYHVAGLDYEIGRSF